MRVSDIDVFTFRSAEQLRWQGVEDLWSTLVLRSARCACVESWTRCSSPTAHTRDPPLSMLSKMFYDAFSSTIFHACRDLFSACEGRGSHVHKCFAGRFLLVKCRRVGALFVRMRDPEIRACRVVSLGSFQRSRCVTRLLSDPRHVAGSLEAKETMPDDGKERLRKSLQSCLRQMLLRLLNKLDTSEVGTSKLLTVSRTHLHTLVPSSDVKGPVCADQWGTLARRLGAGERWVHAGRFHASGLL